MANRSTSKRRSQKAAAGRKECEFPWIAETLRPLAEPLDGLIPDKKNAREHGEANLAAIAVSLRQFGQRKPIVANRRGGIIEAGNGLFLAARSLGWTHLAVVWVEDDPTAATGFSLADNRTAELAAWNDAILAELIGELERRLPGPLRGAFIARPSQRNFGTSRRGPGAVRPRRRAGAARRGGHPVGRPMAPGQSPAAMRRQCKGRGRSSAARRPGDPLGQYRSALQRGRGAADRQRSGLGRMPCLPRFKAAAGRPKTGRKPAPRDRREK